MSLSSLLAGFSVVEKARTPPLFHQYSKLSPPFLPSPARTNEDCSARIAIRTI